MSATKRDPAMHRKLASESFTTAAEADAALERFYEEVYEARVRAKLPDVLLVVGLSILGEDGTPEDSMSRYSMGDELRALPMLAYAFGHESGLSEARTLAMLARGKKRAKT